MGKGVGGKRALMDSACADGTVVHCERQPNQRPDPNPDPNPESKENLNDGRLAKTTSQHTNIHLYTTPTFQHNCRQPIRVSIHANTSTLDTNAQFCTTI